MFKYLFLPFVFLSAFCLVTLKPHGIPYQSMGDWGTAHPPTFSHYLGINLFEWDFVAPKQESGIDENKMEKVKAFGAIRHYLDWERIEPIEGKFTFNPSHTGNWNFDLIYERSVQEDIDILVCLKTIPHWLIETYPESQRDYENVPAVHGSDKSKPQSYLSQAKAAFQFAARYGANKNIDTALIKVNTAARWQGDIPNQVKIGLGYIKYIECDNERDKWWKGEQAYQSPEEYAANLSAFYDGHQGKLGKDVGVKTADPAIQVVMSGLAVPDTNYVSRMIDWCKKNRGLKADGTIDLCFDVINFHAYPGDTDYKQRSKTTVGMAPELTLIGQLANDFLTLSREKAKGMEVWVTETGYDISPKSNIRAIPIGKKSALVTQADWNLRTALLYARSGISRCMFYMLDDVNNSGTQFSTSGFINDDFSPRPSWYYTHQVKALLGNFSYLKTINKNPIVDVYQQQKRTIYVLTVPDQIGRTSKYKLNLGNASKAMVYELQSNSTVVRKKMVNVIGGQLEITVGETPIFVEKL